MPGFGLVAGPEIRPRRYGLVNSGTLVREPDTKWTAGLSFESEECSYAVATLGRDCRPGTGGKAASSDTMMDQITQGHGCCDVIDYVPFMVRVERKCANLLPAQVEQTMKDVVTALELLTERAIEHEAYSGHLATMMNSPNDSFEKIKASYGTLPKAANGAEILGLLEAGLATCGVGGTGVLHLNPKQAALVLSSGCCGFEFDVKANTIYTAMGNQIIIGGGYGDYGPPSNPGAVTDPFAAVDAKHDKTPPDLTYAFATGPVQVRLTDIEVDAAFDRSTNQHTIVAERFAAVTWGTCCRVSITTP